MKPFTSLTIVVFILISIAHLLRAAFGWEVTVNGISIPLWISIVASVITATPALMVWKENQK